MATQKRKTLYAEFLRYVIHEKNGTLDIALKVWRGIPEKTKKEMKNNGCASSDLFDTLLGEQQLTACQEEYLKEEMPLILSKEQYHIFRALHPPSKKTRKSVCL